MGTKHPFVGAEKPLGEGHRLLQEADWGAKVRRPSGSVGSGCAPDPQVFGLYGFAKAGAQTTLPVKVPANIKNIKLLREANPSPPPCPSWLWERARLRGVRWWW